MFIDLNERHIIHNSHMIKDTKYISLVYGTSFGLYKKEDLKNIMLNKKKIIQNH